MCSRSAWAVATAVRPKDREGTNMGDRDWSIEGRYVEYCSCDMGCPCESVALPTQGHCDGVGPGGMKVVAALSFPHANDLAESQKRFPSI